MAVVLVWQYILSGRVAHTSINFVSVLPILLLLYVGFPVATRDQPLELQTLRTKDLDML